MNISGPSRRRASAFLLSLFLFLEAMTAVPALHAMVHSDAADPNHQCAVTMLSHGQITAANVAPPIYYAPAVVMAEPAAPKVVLVSVDVRLLPSRGPPASF